MSTLSPKGQSLVQAARKAYQPTDADRERLFTQLHAQIGDAVGPASTSMAGTKAAVIASAGAKTWLAVTAVTLGLGLVSGTVYLAWPRSTPPVPTAQGAPAAAPEVEAPAQPDIVAPESNDLDLPTPSESPAPAGATTGTTYRSKDRLAVEVALLSRATQDLRAGKAAEALKTLGEYRQKFPKGLLMDSYRAASAQALCTLGRFDEAAKKLSELAADSPLAVRAKELCSAKRASR